MAHAVLEFALAVDVMVSLDPQRRLQRPRWFSLFAKSGADAASPPSGDAESGSWTDPGDKWTVTHCYLANMGGLYLDRRPGASSEAKVAQATKPSTEPLALTGRHLADHWDELVVPWLSQDHIRDKSATDYFSKFIALLQIAQLILSAVVRKLRHLAFSQLEIVTLALAACGFLTYVCYWYKPQDVGVPCWPSP